MATAESDGFLQVLPDGTGKQVDMGVVQTPAGPNMYRQRAELKGDAADAILELNSTMKKLLAVQRAILFALSGEDVDENDFYED